MTVCSLAGSLLILGLLAQTPGGPQRWSVIRSAEGDFSALLPSKPSSSTRQLPTPAGKVEQEIHFCHLNGSLFSVQRIRLSRQVPSGQSAAWLAAQKKSYLGKTGKAADEHLVQRDGVSGEEFGYRATTAGGKGTVPARTQHYLRGRDYYAVTVTAAPDAPLPAETGRFMDSFHFGEPTARSDSMPLLPAGIEDSRTAARTPIADQTPEDALRTFVYAMAVRDEQALRAVTLPAEGFEWLMAGHAAPADMIKELREKLAQQTFRLLQAGDRFAARGQVLLVKADDVGPDRALVLPQGASLPTRIQKINGHWKVDPSGVIAGRKAAETARKKSAAGGSR